LLFSTNIISLEECYGAFLKLKNDSKTRLPKEEIDLRINNLKDLR